MTRTRLSYRALAGLLVMGALAIFGISAASAQVHMESDETLSLGGALSDMGFYAGGNIEVNTVSDDDIFAAGGELSLNGTGADHLFVGGGDIAARNIAVKDLIMAGGNLELKSGVVSDDIIAFGGNVMLRKGLSVGGSVVTSGGNMEFTGDIGGELRATGGNIVLNGPVGGDAFLAAANLTIGPDTVIDGNLTYQADEFSMHPAATVSGQIMVEEFHKKPSLLAPRALFATFVATLIFMAGFGLVILFIVSLFPGLMNQSTDIISDKPFITLGAGILVVIILPVISAFMVATIIGTSAGIAMAMIFLALIPFAVAAFVYFIGMKLRNWSGNYDEPYIVGRIFWTLIGSVLLLVIGFVPILGQIAWLIAIIIGTGAVVTRGGAALANA